MLVVEAKSHFMRTGFDLLIDISDGILSLRRQIASTEDFEVKPSLRLAAVELNFYWSYSYFNIYPLLCLLLICCPAKAKGWVINNLEVLSKS